MATWIKTTGETIPVSFKNVESDFERITKMQELVGGFYEGHKLGEQWLLINEDGLSLGLETNYLLTSIAMGHLCMTAEGIVGNGILFEPGEFEELSE